jgi:hypothetical protein
VVCGIISPGELLPENENTPLAEALRTPPKATKIYNA